MAETVAKVRTIVVVNISSSSSSGSSSSGSSSDSDSSSGSSSSSSRNSRTSSSSSNGNSAWGDVARHERGHRPGGGAHGRMLALRTTAVGSVSCAKSPASYHNVLALGNNLDGSRLKLLMGHGRLMLTFLLQVFFSQPKSHESTPSKTPVTSRPADFSQHDFHSVKWKNNCVRSSLVFMVRTPHVTATMRPSPPTSKGATCAPARGGGRNADTRDEGGGGRTGVLIAGHVSSHKVIPWYFLDPRMATIPGRSTFEVPPNME